MVNVQCSTFNVQRSMKIGIEAQRIFRKNKHGMDYVVLQEIKELQQMNTGDEYYVFVKPGEDRCVEDSANVHVIELECPSYPLWEQWALPRAAKKYGVELLHCTSNTALIAVVVKQFHTSASVFQSYTRTTTVSIRLRIIGIVADESQRIANLRHANVDFRFPATAHPMFESILHE